MYYTNEWRDGLQLTRDLVVAGDRTQFYDAAKKGEYTRLFRGAYGSSQTWRALGIDDRYRMKIYAAVALLDRDILISHDSAAALWRLPSVESWPARIHMMVAPDDYARQSKMLFPHAVGVPETTEVIDGIRVTSLARTVVDVAATRSFAHAVAVADAALRRTLRPWPGVPRSDVTSQDLHQELGAIALRHGSARARRVVEFANPLADRPGESVSRVSLHIARLPVPQLQVTIYGASGRRYVVDFWWPEYNLIGEFDGKDKYSNPEFLQGRTPEQALLDEKAREDDLRATGRKMSRWGWEKALSPRLLAAHLQSAGLR